MFRQPPSCVAVLTSPVASVLPSWGRDSPRLPWKCSCVQTTVAAWRLSSDMVTDAQLSSGTGSSMAVRDWGTWGWLLRFRRDVGLTAAR